MNSTDYLLLAFMLFGTLGVLSIIAYFTVKKDAKDKAEFQKLISALR